MKLCTFLAWLICVACTFASDNTLALRQAMKELTQKFGDQYPHGSNWLHQLDLLETNPAPSSGEDAGKLKADLSKLQRDALVANPLVSGHPILFVVRQQYRPDHHNTATFFPSAPNEYNDGAFTPGGTLKSIDFARSGAVHTIFETKQGVIRDPEVSFDGQRILFSMRTNVADSYHIYEINADGSQLRQLTFARDVDDIDPLYLADGSIGFSSTREPKYCMCNRHVMANLYRMDSNGANIHQIGKSTLFEGHGTLMPDGRILYDRWEYVDRNFGDAQALWTANPDGTSHAIYWGNYTASPGGVIDARILPGLDRAICVFGSCHDRPWGALAIIDRQLGLDGPGPVIRTWPPEATNLVKQSGWEIFDAFRQVPLKYEDPYPLDGTTFLCSRMTGEGEQMGLYLLDLFGNELLLHSEPPGCFDPMPLAPRPRPAMPALRRDYANQPGVFYVQDVYQGAYMHNVKRGSIKWLRVVSSPEKRFWTRPSWGGQGQEAPAMNWNDFNNKRILGTVPVEDDGSAYFEVPSDQFVYFQLLDAQGMMVQSMRSGTMVQSGEQAGCIGCHEDRRRAPENNGKNLMAFRHNPSPLTGWYGPARDFNYLAEVQPVFNRRCLGCHDYEKPAGKVVNLAPDRDLVFNTSYNELWRKKLVKVPGAGPSENLLPYTWGAHASKLVQIIRNEPRCGGSLTSEEMNRIVTWVDLNAPYYPSYASAHPDNLAGRAPLTDQQLDRLERLTKIPLRQLASHNGNAGPQVSFERPELSPCLKTLAQSPPALEEALAIIRAGSSAFKEMPEADVQDFKYCAIDQWRDAKYKARQKTESENRAALRQGLQKFDTP